MPRSTFRHDDSQHSEWTLDGMKLSGVVLKHQDEPDFSSMVRYQMGQRLVAPTTFFATSIV